MLLSQSWVIIYERTHFKLVNTNTAPLLFFTFQTKIVLSLVNINKNGTLLESAMNGHSEYIILKIYTLYYPSNRSLGVVTLISLSQSADFCKIVIMR